MGKKPNTLPDKDEIPIKSKQVIKRSNVKTNIEDDYFDGLDNTEDSPGLKKSKPKAKKVVRKRKISQKSLGAGVSPSMPTIDYDDP